MKSMLLALLLTVVATQAQAGQWLYGCNGQTENGDRVLFNRDSAVIISKQLAAGKLLELTEDSILKYESKDNNSGLEKEIAFDNKFGGTLALKQISTKPGKHSESVIPCTRDRGREVTHDTTINVYEMTIDGAPKPVKAQLNCYEYMVTTCG